MNYIHNGHTHQHVVTTLIAISPVFAYKRKQVMQKRRKSTEKIFTDYARKRLNSILEDGDQGELLTAPKYPPASHPPQNGTRAAR